MPPVLSVDARQLVREEPRLISCVVLSFRQPLARHWRFCTSLSLKPTPKTTEDASKQTTLTASSVSFLPRGAEEVRPRCRSEQSGRAGPTGCSGLPKLNLLLRYLRSPQRPRGGPCQQRRETPGNKRRGPGVCCSHTVNRDVLGCREGEAGGMRHSGVSRNWLIPF